MDNSTKQSPEIDCGGSIEAGSASANCKFTGLSQGAVAGIASACVIGVLAIIAFAMYLIIKRRVAKGEESEGERRMINHARHICSCCFKVDLSHGHGISGNIPLSSSNHSFESSRSASSAQLAVVPYTGGGNLSSVLPATYNDQVEAGMGRRERFMFNERRQYKDGRVRVTEREAVTFTGIHDGDMVVANFAREGVEYENNSGWSGLAAITGGNN